MLSAEQIMFLDGITFAEISAGFSTIYRLEVQPDLVVKSTHTVSAATAFGMLIVCVDWPVLHW